jgi:hypothetical protein
MNKDDAEYSDKQMLRRKAEERLKSRKTKENPVLESDIKKLMHELQVHQIELEMQNEELREANDRAEAALKKYTMMYDLSPMGYFTLESDCSISELNFTGADMLQDKRIRLLNSNFKLFVAEKSLPVFNDFFNRLFESNSKESCEVMLGYEDVLLCHVYMEGVVTGDEGKCLLSVVDISEFTTQKSL